MPDLRDDGVRVLTGQVYAAVPGYRPLLLDLVLPPAPPAGTGTKTGTGPGTPHPVVVFVHGGGWRVGSRDQVVPALREVEPEPLHVLARHGIAVVAVDHRLSGEATWPAPLHDVKAAVRWVRAHADELGLDPDRIAAWGESAGGHLACLLGLVTDPDLEGEVGVVDQPSSVCAVVAWYPPTDLVGMPDDLGRPDSPDSRESQLLGATATERPDLAAQASPLAHVGSDSTKQVPFLLRHGDADELVPLAQSQRLADALARAGGDVELQQVLDGHHMWAGRPADARAALDATVAFLVEHLAPTTPHDPTRPPA